MATGSRRRITTGYTSTQANMTPYDRSAVGDLDAAAVASDRANPAAKPGTNRRHTSAATEVVRPHRTFANAAAKRAIASRPYQDIRRARPAHANAPTAKPVISTV